MAECNDTSIPTVDETALECCELVGTNCVVTSEAIPCIRVGKGSTLTALFKKLCKYLGEISFLSLADTPSTYTGLGGQLVIVNAAETGLETVGTQNLPFAEYTVATVPAAATNQGAMVMVTDEVGGYVPAFSDGTNWRRVTDRNIIA